VVPAVGRYSVLLAWVGLGREGSGRVGLDWVGLGWFALSWVGFGLAACTMQWSRVYLWAVAKCIARSLRVSADSVIYGRVGEVALFLV